MTKYNLNTMIPILQDGKVIINIHGVCKDKTITKTLIMDMLDAKELGERLVKITNG